MDNICLKYEQEEQMLLKIGEFSSITGISVKTLRYYDDIDLFKPSDVDLFTGYRYYHEDQIKDLQLINDLKNIGFTLEEIKNNWNNFNEDIFIKKKQELLKEIELKQEAIKKVDEFRSKLSNGKITEQNNEQKVRKMSLY